MQTSIDDGTTFIDTTTISNITAHTDAIGFETTSISDGVEETTTLRGIDTFDRPNSTVISGSMTIDVTSSNSDSSLVTELAEGTATETLFDGGPGHVSPGNMSFIGTVTETIDGHIVTSPETIETLSAVTWNHWFNDHTEITETIETLQGAETTETMEYLTNNSTTTIESTFPTVNNVPSAEHSVEATPENNDHSPTPEGPSPVHTPVVEGPGPVHTPIVEGPGPVVHEGTTTSGPFGIIGEIFHFLEKIIEDIIHFVESLFGDTATSATDSDAFVEDDSVKSNRGFDLLREDVNGIRNNDQVDNSNIDTDSHNDFDGIAQDPVDELGIHDNDFLSSIDGDHDDVSTHPHSSFSLDGMDTHLTTGHVDPDQHRMDQLLSWGVELFSHPHDGWNTNSQAMMFADTAEKLTSMHDDLLVHQTVPGMNDEYWNTNQGILGGHLNAIHSDLSLDVLIDIAKWFDPEILHSDSGIFDLADQRILTPEFEDYGFNHDLDDDGANTGGIIDSTDLDADGLVNSLI